MKKTLLLIITIAISSSAFGGMIMGTLEVPGTPTDTAWVFAFHDFTTLLDTAFFYTFALPPDYDYVIDDPGIIDDYDYNVMALIAGSIPPESGSPAGQYPDNPFRITGGTITGIDVELSEIGGLDGHVTYSGDPDSLKLDIYNQYPMLLGGSPTLDGTWEIGDTAFSLDSIPSGAKTAIVWADVNGNGICDTTGFLDEPNAWHQNELDGIFILGGGVNSEIDFNLETGAVSERQNMPSELGLRCFPNPFNSTVSILLAGNGEPVKLQIYDIGGRLIDEIGQTSSFEGYSLIRYSPKKEMSAGVYMLRATDGTETKTETIVYMK